jgi:hypothetical protein
MLGAAAAFAERDFLEIEFFEAVRPCGDSSG